MLYIPCSLYFLEMMGREYNYTPEVNSNHEIIKESFFDNGTWAYSYKFYKWHKNRIFKNTYDVIGKRT